MGEKRDRYAPDGGKELKADDTVFDVTAWREAMQISLDDKRSQISFDDTPSIDAFGRLRTATPTLLLDMKRVGGVTDAFATTSTSGSGATAYSSNTASTTLTVGTAVGKATRQTKARAVYQAGKSLLIFQTFTMAPTQTNLRQRVGYFDDKNGVFLEQHGTNAYVVIRTYKTGTATETKVHRDDWDDPVDGTGSSGITLDPTKAHILAMDLEWLGVGRVRIGFVVNGIIYYVYSFLHANNLTGVYMSNPNLPVRWEIEALDTVTGTPGLEAICCSVNAEGGYEINGVTASTDSTTTAHNIASGANGEILAIRMQSTFTEFATAFVQKLSAINTSSGPFRWQLVLNPTETVAGTWSSITGSVMERNTTRTVTANTGTVLDSGFVSAQSNSINIDSRPVLTMGTTLAGVTDILSLQIFNLNNQSEDYYGSLTWREVF